MITKFYKVEVTIPEELSEFIYDVSDDYVNTVSDIFINSFDSGTEECFETIEWGLFTNESDAIECEKHMNEYVSELKAIISENNNE